MKKFLALSVIVLALNCIAVSPASAQCSMCKATAENSVRYGQKKGLGLNTGILLLLSMPYVAACVVGGLWYRNSRYRKVKSVREIG
ncbi:MAG: hypothetical protein NTX03_04630 [Bacteroidetes bacterium]|nr:hypothetical protein [Bacteroidota bacterium]